jgi:hypothetical protein
MGGVGSGRKSKATAACPRPGHAGSRVKFDATYGPPGHRRQRYRCVPANGDRPHVFTGTLPREESWHADCEVCERPVQRHDGPQAARQYQFVARGIAGTLLSVGAGASYMRAARVARQRANRLRVDPDTGDLRLSKHGQLVADWVEVFAPVVFESHRPNDWPSEGTLVLDHLPFRVKAFNPSGRAVPGGRVVFDVFAAMGYERGEPRIWRLEAFPNASAANWVVFLSRLGGQPPRVVCDNHSGMTSAVRSYWPTTDLYLCEWHLRHALERLLAAQARRGYGAAVAALQPRVEAAFAGLSFWRPFVADCRSAGVPALDAWLDAMDPVIQSQFGRRGFAATRPKNMPLTTGGLEQRLRPIRDAIHPRRYALKNRERTNRLLMLMQLHANNDDSEPAYRKSILEWLLANDGRPRGQRRSITDDLGAPSLR